MMPPFAPQEQVDPLPPPEDTEFEVPDDEPPGPEHLAPEPELEHNGGTQEGA